jgi:hypothetical protein
MSNYPPGMPGPRSELVELTCAECGHKQSGVIVHELGGHFLTGALEDGCEKCGGDWDDDKTEPVEAPEPDYDEWLDRQQDDAEHERRFGY